MELKYRFPHEIVAANGKDVKDLQLIMTAYLFEFASALCILWGK